MADLILKLLLSIFGHGIAGQIRANFYEYWPNYLSIVRLMQPKWSQISLGCQEVVARYLSMHNERGWGNAGSIHAMGVTFLVHIYRCI